MNDILIQIAKKAADEWKGDQAYHQASELIYLLIPEIERQNATPANPPLTLDELRGMVGEPVWVAEEESYAIVTMDKQGCYANQVFVRGVRHMRDGVEYGFGINYELDVKKRRLQCYRHKPEREGTNGKTNALD